MRAALLFAVALLACDKHAAESKATPPPSASAPAAPSVQLTLDGKDVPVADAMIRKTPTGLQVYLGKGGTCEEMAQHVYMERTKFVLVDLDAPQSDVAKVVRVWHGPPDDADPGGKVTLHGDPATAQKVDLDLAFTSKEAKLSASGTVSASVCK